MDNGVFLKYFNFDEFSLVMGRSCVHIMVSEKWVNGSLRALLNILSNIFLLFFFFTMKILCIP